MNWCCLGFEQSFANAGQAGFAVFGVTLEERKSFRLQFRTLPESATQLVAGVMLPGPLLLVQAVPIRYCPWCRTELIKHYRRRFDLVDRSDLWP